MRPSTPRLAQYWKAIFSACSTAAAPSEANRKCGSSTGTTRASASASSTTTRFPLPRRVEWATRSIWARSGGVELGDPVAERGDPQRRDGVEVAPSLDVDQLAALGRLDDDGFVVEVARHLGEAVPHDGGIPFTPRPGVDHDPPACQPPTPRRRIAGRRAEAGPARRSGDQLELFAFAVEPVAFRVVRRAPHARSRSSFGPRREPFGRSSRRRPWCRRRPFGRREPRRLRWP